MLDWTGGRGGAWASAQIRLGGWCSGQVVDRPDGKVDGWQGQQLLVISPPGAETWARRRDEVCQW